MYDREIDGTLLDFEASGALYHNALVMQDDQTASFWAVISSQAIGGPKQGTKLVELPISQKTTWKQWLKSYPETLLLSVDGRVHEASNPYDNYFSSEKTFRPVEKPDQRLSPKASVFAFLVEGRPFAIPHKSLASGWQGVAGDLPVFLYRGENDAVYRSTLAYQLVNQHQQAVTLERKRKHWIVDGLGKFYPDRGVFGKEGVSLPPLQGLDTFWYIWSQYYPQTVLLAAGSENGE